MDNPKTIWEFALYGDIPAVQDFLKTNRDVNSVDDHDNSLLHAAVLNKKIDRLKLVKFLVENKSDVNLVNRNQRTPICEAALEGHIEVVKYIFDNNADITIADSESVTPLFAAVSGNHHRIVDLLAKNVADVNIADAQEIIPIHEAALKEIWTLSKFCLTITATSMSKSESVMDLSITQLSRDILPLSNTWQTTMSTGVTTMAKNVKIDVLSQDLVSPVFLAAQNGHFEVVKFLVERGASVDTADDQGDAPVIAAASGEHFGIVKYLVQKNADVNSVNKRGLTTLAHVVARNNTSMAKFLMEKGALVNDIVIEVSILNTNVEIVKLIFDNSKPNVGHLLVAARSGCLDIVTHLLSFRFDPNSRNENGLSPLHVASTLSCLPVVEFIIKNDADVNSATPEGVTALHGASTNGYLDVVKALVTNGADVNVPDLNRVTPLYMAADVKEESSAVVKYLVEKKARPDIVDTRYEHTPLMAALMTGNVQSAKVLIESGADVKVLDLAGNNLLHFAIAIREFDLVKVLVQRGVDGLGANQSGQTQLWIADQTKQDEIVNFIKEHHSNGCCCVLS
ncbi:hypothetical protein Zmor_012053 [Zophobas morio]|uniref:Ankyrin repeat protein n=1 Tax=Zophobas morio TaxID=2755281 RepID=A0AA38HH07_9CUCU|nr:hypothetical protein Zmor_012053 [Zophobas morio]